MLEDIVVHNQEVNAPISFPMLQASNIRVCISHGITSTLSFVLMILKIPTYIRHSSFDNFCQLSVHLRVIHFGNRLSTETQTTYCPDNKDTTH